MSATHNEYWVALLEDGKLAELMFDRPDQGRLVGDIFLGKVEAVLPGIQAAFVDIGTEKAGFLHVSDLVQDDDDEDGDNGAEPGQEGDGAQGAQGAQRGGGQGGKGQGRRGKGGADKGSSGKGRDGGRNDGGRRRQRQLPPIQDLVKKGQEILVQVSKEPIGTKGARLTAQVSLPGRFLVFMPFSHHIGVSRKIDDRGERARLKRMAKDIVTPDAGIIIRTVGEELTERAFKNEFKSLHNTWRQIKKKSDQAKAPLLVREEAKLVSGIIRDLFSNKFESIIIDNKSLHNEVLQYVRNIDPDLVDRVQHYQNPEPLFDKYGVHEDIAQAFERKVMLQSGGHIIIDPTEALVSIDVNTGRFTGKRDPEATILKTNLDAGREVARQLRLRDIGGIVVIDFIDMESQQNRDKVLHEFRSHLGRDRARTKTFPVSDLGLLEMTRQRVRPSLFQSLTERCPTCDGAGRLFRSATVVRRIERSLRRVAAAGGEKKLVIRVHPEVALHILESEPEFLKRLSKRTRIDLALRDDPLMTQDQFRLLSGPAETDVTAKFA